MVEDHNGNEETKEADPTSGVPEEGAEKPSNEVEVQNKGSKRTSDENDPKNDPARLPTTKRNKLSNFEKGVS
jgi:hypothetical protein